MYGFNHSNMGGTYPRTLNSIAKELEVGPYKLRDYLREKGVFDIDNNLTPEFTDTGNRGVRLPQSNFK